MNITGLKKQLKTLKSALKRAKGRQRRIDSSPYIRKIILKRTFLKHKIRELQRLKKGAKK